MYIANDPPLIFTDENEVDAFLDESEDDYETEDESFSSSENEERFSKRKKALPFHQCDVCQEEFVLSKHLQQHKKSFHPKRKKNTQKKNTLSKNMSKNKPPKSTKTKKNIMLKKGMLYLFRFCETTISKVKHI